MEKAVGKAMIDFKNHPISFREVFKAQSIVKFFVKPTQLTYYAGFSELVGADVYIKHENHNPTGSFKIRGGVNLMHHLRDCDIKGVITFSTGNHGISIATAASWYGLHATVVVPEGNNPSKNKSINETGATLIESGKTFEEASKTVEALCRQSDIYYAHPANEPHLINGVGTEFIEIFNDLPDIDTIILPLGAGSEVAAAITVFKQLSPKTEIIAVQAESSPAAYNSWKKQEICSAKNKTFAGGFATGIAYEIPFSIYSKGLHDFLLLTEEELVQSMVLSLNYTHNLGEPSGTSTLMAAIKLRNSLKGKKVVLQMSGCNACTEEIEKTVSHPTFKDSAARTNL